jgi:hypothetical protein
MTIVTTKKSATTRSDEQAFRALRPDPRPVVAVSLHRKSPTRSPTATTIAPAAPPASCASTRRLAPGVRHPGIQAVGSGSSKTDRSCERICASIPSPLPR